MKQTVRTAPLPTSGSKTVSKKPLKISRTKAIELLNSVGGKIFNVTFIKGTSKGKPEERNLTGRKNLPKSGEKVEGAPKLKKGADLKSMGYITMYDMLKKSTCAIDTRTIQSLKMNGEQYLVK